MTETRPSAPGTASATSTAPGLRVATLSAVRSIVAHQLKKGGSRRIIGIHALPEWHGEPSFTVEDAVVHVRPCPSALAVREALTEHALTKRDTKDYLVVLTDVDDADLGAGVRVHLAGGRLHVLRPWEMVKEAFSAHTIDPLLLDERWAADALINREPAGGWPPAPGGALTRDHALGNLASAVFGTDPAGQPYLTPEHLDAPGLLLWTLDPVAVARFTELPEEVRDGLTGWLGTVLGPAGRWTLRAVTAGHGGDAVPLALVAGLLWERGAGPSAAEARGLVRARLGGEALPAEEAQAWARAAQAALGRLDRPDALLDRAEELLREFNATEVIARSTLLPEAYAMRLREFARALRQALPGPGPSRRVPDVAALQQAEDAHARLLAHELAGHNPRTRTATMALRLLRWLATPKRPAATLAEAVHEQVRTGAYVDRALADVWTGDQDDEVAAAYRALLEVAAERRTERDRVLARHLAAAVEADSEPGTLVPIESALGTLVRPLGRSLLLVLDGMTAAVLAELADELIRDRWTELVDSSLGHRRALLPALPTVTEACRTSLLTGTLRIGGQHDEKAAFPGAVGDPQARLFHKDDLRAPAGHALHPDVKAAIDGPARVVGVVLNAIDDSLDKMDPGGTTWALDQVPYLRALTEAARAAGRRLILTSDHGHVVERGGTALTAHDTGAARWRPAGGPVSEGEIEIRGRRVLLGGGAVVLPWREDLRYGAKRAGYHGGASAAEVAVPFAVFSTVAGDDIAGWAPAPVQEPTWWNAALTRAQLRETTRHAGAQPGAHRAAAARGTGTRSAKGRSPEVTGQTELALDAVAPEPAGEEPVSPVERYLDELLASDLFREQCARAGRVAPDVALVRNVLAALLEAGGRLHQSALSAQAKVPATRMTAALAAVRRVLSVDGYDPIGYDPDGETVVLSADVLAEQFGIPVPRQPDL